MAHTEPTKTQKSLGKTVDKGLLKILTDGRDVVTKKGQLVHIDATAADYTAAIRRLKDCGVTAELHERDPIERAIRKHTRKGKKRGKKGKMRLVG